MKIALAQTNPTIGAFNANVEKIISFCRQARKANAELIIFPELALSGYPPQDLLEHPAFIQDHDAALNTLEREIKDIALICGIISRNTGAYGKRVRNSAILLSDGQRHTLHKRLLPTYDVFDESRYFEPGSASQVLKHRELSMGITICEDLFNPPSSLNIPREECARLTADAKPYDKSPLDDLLSAREPPDILINIAASPFHQGKPQARRKYLHAVSRGCGLPLIYVNQVGGQDSLVFDGRSMAFAADGGIISQAKAYEEDLLIVDSNAPSAPSEGQSSTDMDIEELFGALVLGTRDYVHKCGFRKVVIGLSGGIDSALTAAIAVESLGSDMVLGVALPSPHSSQGSIDDARALARNLGIEFQIIPIGDIFKSHLRSLRPLFSDYPEDLTEQNLQARIRGTLLMALANKFNRLLLSTGNKSEMAVGYCTLYGDMNGGLAVISDIPKTMVYRICEFLNRNGEVIPLNTITKAPSAELAPGQTDQDDLPPYEILDPILAAHLEERMGAQEIIAAGFESATVHDVLRRVRINEYKRKQAPMGLKVTSKAFGYGRRYPTAHGYVP